MTGIPDLLPDPRMYGGGTHENIHGQELDPHVDFNYDQDDGYHRRINQIVYLNKGWQESWGGSIELHSNPRDPSTNRISSFNCIFNRAVIFETNEYSWHGFPKLQLPEEHRDRSRKSLSIYPYTRDRPQAEIAPSHGTFYIPRPLSFDLVPDQPLSAQQIVEIQAGLKNRDGWIYSYQGLELRLGQQLRSLSNYIADLLSHVRAPVVGKGVQRGTSAGLYHDGWVAPKAHFSILPEPR